MHETVCPLIFEPIFKPRVWGGTRLRELLGKNFPGDGPVGESWEVADLEEDQSVVSRGPAKGRTLGELVRTWKDDLTGRAGLFEGRFPLLIKFLDARERLSVQVHPDEAAAKRLGGRVRVKNEAWYVIDAGPEACIHHGLRDGIDANELRAAVAEHRIEELLRSVPARKGHCYDLPSGTIHALGAGIVVAEVQTPSDVTYRLHDWDRVDPTTGQARTLHLEEALACASFASINPEQPSQHTASVWTTVTSLCRNDSFVIERVRMVDGVEMMIPHSELVVWIVLEGQGSIGCDGVTEPLLFGRGDTVVLPAGLKQGRVRTLSRCLWLEVTVPVRSDLAGFEHPVQGSIAGPPTNRYVPLGLPHHGQGA